MRIHFLGTGGAEGIPAMGCDCGHCNRARREGGRLVRQRSAAIFTLPGYELLLDTPPDIRELLNANGTQNISGIFLSHEHFDHAGGLEEFLYWHSGVDLFATPHTYQRLVRAHWSERLPDVAFHIAFRPGVAVRFNNFFFTPFEVRHSVPTYGLVFYEGQRRIVHAADSSKRLSNYARSLIEGADILILNTPFFWPREDDTHMSVVDAIAFKHEANVKRLILTHANHFNLPHDELEAHVAQFDGVTVAYDGLTIDV